MPTVNQDAATGHGAAPAPRLTTTAYAILGVLAIKERTAYELAAEMRHCFEYFWPRDDKRVYADARRLADAGLATAHTRHIGRRPQTTYRITPAGEAALRDWLQRPAAPPALDLEPLIKVYLARFGSPGDLLATIDDVTADADFMLSVAANVRDIYLTGCAPFQDEYIHVWVFVYDFLTSYFALLRDWAQRTRAVAETWSDLSPDGKRGQALALFEAKRPAPPARPAAGPAMPGGWRQHTENRTQASTTDRSRRARQTRPGT